MATECYRFRDFRLDPAARELWRGGELVELPSRAFDCMVYLVRNRDRAVGRDELISAVWGRVNIADALLAQTILRLRRALGDSGSRGAVRTVARFGYRWVEETHVDDAGSAAASPPSMAAPSDGAADETAPSVAAAIGMANGGRRLGRPSPWWLAVAGLALLAAWLVLGPLSREAPADATAHVGGEAGAGHQAAVVLPAEVPADLPDWAWLRLGLMDMVGNRLRMGGQPTVPSENVLAMLVDGPEEVARIAGDPSILLAIQPVIERRADGWLVRLETRAPDGAARVEMTAAEPVEAAHGAADLLLIRLGRAPPASADARPLEQDDLLLRVRAAVLADQFDVALELIERAPPALRGHAELELEQARIEQGQGRYAQAEQRLLALRQRADAQADPVLRGRILSAAGAVYFRRLNLDDAERAFAEAIEMLVDRGDPIGLANAYMGRAAVASRHERLDEAAADLGRARVEMEAGGDLLGMAQIDMNLGLIQIKRYRPASGLSLLREAERRFVGMGAREQLAYARYVIAGAQLQLLDLDGAQATVAAFWPPEAHTGNERLHWRLALSRAFVLTSTGQLGAAEEQLLQIRGGTGDDDDAAVLIGVQALSALITAIRGRHDEAVVQLRAVLATTLREQRPDQFVATWTAYLRSLRHSGQIDLARAETARFDRWVQAHPNPWREVQRALAVAEQAWADEPGDGALQRFGEAFGLAQQLAIPEDLVHVAEPYAMALIEQGLIDRASAVVGRVAAWADQDVRAAWAQAQLFRAQSRTEAWQRAMARVEQLRGERILPAVDAD